MYIDINKIIAFAHNSILKAKNATCAYNVKSAIHVITTTHNMDL